MTGVRLVLDDGHPAAQQYLWSQLARVGVTPECFEPGDDPPLAVLALGRQAAASVMGWAPDAPEWRIDHWGYVLWSAPLRAWAVLGPSPAQVMRRQHHLAQILQWCAQRALEVGAQGFAYDAPDLRTDLDPDAFEAWVEECLAAAATDPARVLLSYDIETPWKRGRSEDALGGGDADDDRSMYILRWGLCWRDREAISVPNHPPYQAGLVRLFSSAVQGLNWNGELYDNVRIRAAIPTFNLRSLDVMLAWHVLQSSLPKGLGFVTPFYWPTAPLWKHAADAEPARYNALDALAAWKCWAGIEPHLRAHDLYPVYERHVLRLNAVLRYMTDQGVQVDAAWRRDAEARLRAELARVQQAIEAAVPLEARTLKRFSRTPASLEGCIQVPGQRLTQRCTRCGAVDVPAAHVMPLGRKQRMACRTCGQPEARHAGLLSDHLFALTPDNPCAGARREPCQVPALVWARVEPLKLSTKTLLAYQRVRRHRPVRVRGDGGTWRSTFDESAIRRLAQQYPDDPLYRHIVQYRKLHTLLSRYIGRTDPANPSRWRGGLQVGADGRVHTTYTHNPATLRLASQNPNLQNLPRPNHDNPDAPENLVRGLIVPTPGWIIGAADFAGIEAVLVGYEARAPQYYRLARRDVHSFYTAYALYEVERRIPANDLPLLSWDDDKLFGHLAAIKQAYTQERNGLYKHLVHAANFGQTAAGARRKIYEETGRLFDLALVTRVMHIYRDLFPEIPAWQAAVRAQAHTDGYLRNAFGYVLRVNHVFRHERTEAGWEQLPGDDAQVVLAFRPQSNAAGILKEAMLRLFEQRFDEAGQYLRLTTHDELWWECPPERLAEVTRICVEEMERPVAQMPLPPEWQMGPAVSVLAEAKSGLRWSELA